MVCCLCGDPSASAPAGDLDGLARACSPRVASRGNAVLFDADGLSRVCGPPAVIVREVLALAAAEGLHVRVALAGTMTAAWVLAHAHAGATVVPEGHEAAALAPLPVGWLGAVVDLDHVHEAQPVEAAPATSTFKRGRRGGRHFRMAPGPPDPIAGPDRSAVVPRRVSASPDHDAKAYAAHFVTLGRWGIRTCGELAALPRADVRARLGPSGVRLHQAASGEDVVPLTPVDEARRFVDRLELEWPIEGLEPLSFVLARQFERLSATLERADRGATAITSHLTLVDRTRHTRTLQLPAPMRDARVLRTLVLLDLESHPPAAGIDVVELVLEVAPGHILQGSLLAHAVPSQEDLSTLLARLGALMGESRLGAPIVLDTYDARQVALVPFRLGSPGTTKTGAETSRPAPPGTGVSRDLPGFAFRRFRLPLAVRVAAEHGTPVRILAGAAVPAGRVVACAGPWRSSGGWWHLDRTDWDRDEWDVELESGVVCRLARRRNAGTWEIEGLFD